MKKLWIFLSINFVILFILGGSFIGIYNKFISLGEGINAEWSQVDTQLQRRSDLIPNLVNTVKGYAKHEKEIFENVAEARSKLAGAKNVNEKIYANQQLDSALARLLMVVEKYPDLKANDNFVRLQDELAGTENRIAVARQRYNETVRSYNVAVKKFPEKLVAIVTGFQEKDVYFKVDESAKKTPKIEF